MFNLTRHSHHHAQGEVPYQDLKPYADAYFEYDSSHRVNKAWFDGECGCSGGANGQYVYAYGTNGCDDIKERAPNGTVRTLINARTAHGLSGDCHVDGTDLMILLRSWGPVGKRDVNPAADLDGNGIVNGFDLGILLAAWG